MVHHLTPHPTRRRSAGTCPLPILLIVLLPLSFWSPRTEAQDVHYLKPYHLTVGSSAGLYVTAGGFDLGDQHLDLLGVHLDLVRLGITHIIAPNVKMGLTLLLGGSWLADPGYRGTTATGELGESSVGFHWGAEISGYYRFPFGLTLGLGVDLTVANGEFLDTSFFRAIPAIGWELQGPLEVWTLHAQWVTAVTLLHGLEEWNTQPSSNLTWTGAQVTYGF